jgi:hypothetical protein
MSRVCVICVAKNRAAIDAALLGGVPDRVVSRQFHIPNSSVQRHRMNHLVRPVQDQLAILTKDTNEKRQRQELAEAARAYTPTINQVIEATLGMKRQMEKLNNIEARLERMAQASEQAGSPVGVSQLSSQQLRAIETGAKLGGIGGFKPPSVIPQASDRAVWSIQMFFQEAGRTEEIGILKPVINGDLNDAPEDAEKLPTPHPNRKIKPDEKLSGSYWDFSALPKGNEEDDDADKER